MLIGEHGCQSDEHTLRNVRSERDWRGNWGPDYIDFDRPQEEIQVLL